MEDTTYFPLCLEIICIILHDQLLFFDHSFFHSILFFILSYLSYPWWSSSFEVDLLLSEAFSSIMLSLTLGASDFIGVNLELSSLVLWNKLWKLNPGVRTITLTTIANYTCKLLTKETEYGLEH